MGYDTRDENKCLEPATDGGAVNSRLNIGIKTVGNLSTEGI